MLCIGDHADLVQPFRALARCRPRLLTDSKVDAFAKHGLKSGRGDAKFVFTWHKHRLANPRFRRLLGQRAAPVSTLRISTSAPGSTAPRDRGSVPCKLAPTVCANSARSAKQQNDHCSKREFMSHPPATGKCISFGGRAKGRATVVRKSIDVQPTVQCA